MENKGKIANYPAKIAVIVVCILLTAPLVAFDSAFSSVESQTEEVVFYPFNISQLASAYSFAGYNVDQIRTAYGLPDTGGSGVTIAIIIAYDTPTIFADLTEFSKQNNLPLPNSTNFEVHKMADNINSGNANGWSLEACLDVEWAHAIAPDAKILLVEAVNGNSNSLFGAIQYANNRPDVVAVSMSWGTNEYEDEVMYDHLFSEPNRAYFAASGDTGSVVMYPSSSPYVVAVGGTTLNLDENGNVVSETAWSGSGGGVSKYEKIPAYQKSYGLTGNYRCVPDVSYNANSATGVRVYYSGSWYIVGGTSASAPQWAGIYALGASASLGNLYEKAKVAPSTYFRDITSGSTSKYSAAAGYDYITGLGSPLSFNFEDFLTVSPTSGGPQTNITLSGVGLTGPTADVSYLNPTNSTWMAFENNVPVVQGNLTFNTAAPDLMQCNPSGDSTQAYDSIIFRVLDIGNLRAYNTTVPFTEYRRGLTQVGNATASAVFGSDTDLTGSVIARKGDLLTVNGVWFSPGNVALLWDNITIGNLTINQGGTFSTNITVPSASTGQHALTVQNDAVGLSVYVTYMPTLTTDYNNPGTWRVSDFTVNIAADSAVNEIYYRVNGGETLNVSANGQPLFYFEGANNTLEYWCTWNRNETALLETAHVNITGIMLDKSPPMGSVMTKNIAESKTITIILSAIDTASGVTFMRFSNDGNNWSSWKPYTTTDTWTLEGSDGMKTVYAQFLNTAGLVSTCSTTVNLMTTPVATPHVSAEPTITPTSAPTATPTATPTTTASPTDNPTPTVPELSLGIVFIALVGASLVLLLMKKRIKH